MKKTEIIEELKHFRKDLRRFSAFSASKSAELRLQGDIDEANIYYGYAWANSNTVQDLDVLIRHLERNLRI